MPTDRESYKINYGGVGKYAPFKMKAAGHGNSPVEKNWGTAEQRGFPLKAFGTKDSEGQDKISTDSDFSPFSFNTSAAVGSSPNKWFGGGAIKAARGIFKRVKDKIAGKKEAAAAANEAATAAETPTVPMHGEESHTGGAGAVGGAIQGGMAAAAEAPLEDPAAAGIEPAVEEKTVAGMNKEEWKEKQKLWSQSAHRASMMFSDVRLKENIKRIGVSPSGIPTYEFNYIGSNNRYSGAMAQDLLDSDVTSLHQSGYYMVDYDKIDVDMKLI